MGATAALEGGGAGPGCPTAVHPLLGGGLLQNMQPRPLLWKTHPVCFLLPFYPLRQTCACKGKKG